VNRNDLQEIALIRLREAKALLDNDHYDGAYYLSGYAVECALKSCIAKQTKRHDFPNKKIVNESYTHSLIQLVRVAGLQTALDQEMQRDAIFVVNWTIVKDWAEDSRYERHTQKAAEDIYAAISNNRHGVFRWLKRYW
jgi:HEPN domain-containing protein